MGGGGFGLARLIHGFTQFHGRLRQGFHLFIDGGRVFAFLDFTQGFHVGFDGLAFVLGNLVAEFFKVLFSHMNDGFRLVFSFHHLAQFLVLAGVFLGLLDHALNVFIGQSARRLDTDLLFLAGGFVLGRNVDDAVGVDVESNLDLRHATRRRGQAHKVELSQHLVV